MKDDATTSKVNEEDLGKQKNGAVHFFMEWVLPLNIVILFISLLVLFIWIGPVAVFKFILSFLPKDPGLSHALILGAVIVISIVLPTPLWPPLMIVAAMVFGFWYGFLICYCAMVLGAVISFWIGRLLLMEPFRDYIETSDYHRVRRMIRVVEAEGNSLKFTFLFRFLYLPIWIRNYVPAIVHIEFWHFLISVLCHAVMICMIFAATGTATKDLSEVIAQGQNPWSKMKPQQILIFVVSATATGSLSYLAIHEYSKRLEEEDAEAILGN